MDRKHEKFIKRTLVPVFSVTRAHGWSCPLSLPIVHLWPSTVTARNVPRMRMAVAAMVGSSVDFVISRRATLPTRFFARRLASGLLFTGQAGLRMGPHAGMRSEARWARNATQSASISGRNTRWALVLRKGGKSHWAHSDFVRCDVNGHPVAISSRN